MTERTCDLVVLGGGGSGLTAAVRAAQLSGKKVIVVEKAGNTGGGMIMASTMRTFRSKWQEQRGLPDVTDAYLRKVMDDTYWRLDPELVGSAILGTGAFFDWFCDLAGDDVGDRFRVGRYVFDDDNGPLGPQMGGPGGKTGGGRLFMDVLRAKCGELGVEVLTRHRAKSAQVEDGRITAILADSPEGEVRIACKACILATGSWINNAELMAQICPQFLEAKKHMDPSPHTNPNYTGDGFAIAQAVDAKLDEENYVLRLMGPMVFSKSGVLSNMGNSPFTLAINTQGKRYVCEPSQIRNGVFNSGLMMMEQPQGYVYILFDSNNLAAALKDAQENPKPPAPGVFGLPPLPDTLEGALEELEQALAQEQGVFRGDTPAELAEKMGVPVQALEETVEKYNRYCAEGFDRTCFKQREYLVPCDQPPYYAVRAKLGTDGAFGGVLVNGRMQAYRADGSVIPGLYVTGDFASGRFLNMAGAKVQVLNDMSWALSSGFLAGTNVCEEL